MSEENVWKASNSPNEDITFSPRFCSTPLINNDHFNFMPQLNKAANNFAYLFEENHQLNVPFVHSNYFNLNTSNYVSIAETKPQYHLKVSNETRYIDDSILNDSRNSSITDRIKNIVKKVLDSESVESPSSEPVIEENKYNKENIDTYVDMNPENYKPLEYSDKCIQTCSSVPYCALKHSKIGNIKDIDACVKKLRYGVSKYGCNFKKISKVIFKKEKIRPVDLYILFRRHIVKP